MSPADEDRRSELHQPNEDRQPQDPVDDRGNAGEVADVRLEQAVHPAIGRVLVEVDGRRDPHREGDDADDDPDHQRADQGGQDAGVRRSSRRATGDELPVEPGQAANEDIDQQHDQGEEQDPDRHDAQPVEDRAAELAAHERRFEPDGRVHRRGRRHRHQYSVRNLRTTQPLSRLRTSVNTNSVAATAKSDFELDGPLRCLADGDLRDERRHRLDALRRVEGELRLITDGQRDDHRFADGAARREDDRRHDPRDRGREDDLADHLELGGTHRVRTLPHAARDRAHRIVRDRRDQRRDEQADDDPPDSAEKVPMFCLPRIGMSTCGARKLTAKKPRTIVGIPAIVSRSGLTDARTRGEA